MKVCSISLDAEEYKKDLEKVVSQTKNSVSELNNAVNNTQKVTADTGKSVKETMSSAGSEAKKTAEGVDAIARAFKNVLDNAVKNTQKVTADTGNSFKKTMSSAGADAKKAAEGVGSIAGAFNMLSPKIGVIGSLLESAVLGPIGLITAAVGLLVSAGMAAFNALTESTEVFAQKAAAASEKIQQQNEKMQNLENVTKSYLSQLQTMANMEMASYDRKEATANILKVLESRYGDLGAEIDETTGKLNNYLNVQDKINKISAENQIKRNTDLMSAKAKEAMASYIKTRTLDVGITDGRAKREFISMYNLEGPEDIKKYLQNTVDKSTDEDDLGYLETIKFLNEVIELKKKNNMLSLHGVETEEELLQKNLQQQKVLADMQSNLESRRKQFERRQHEDKFNDTSDFDARKKNRQQLLDEEIAEYNALDKKYDTARMRNSKEEMAELELKIQASLERQYDLKRQITAVDKEKTDFLKQQTEELKRQQAEKQKQIEAERKAQQQRLADFRQSMQSQALSLYGKAMTDAGFGQQIARNTALRDAEKTKGAKLSESEKKMVIKLSDLSFTDIGNSKDIFSSFDIKSNELTSRGGFQSGAVSNRTDTLNRSILEQNRKHTEHLRNIESICRTLGVF